MSHRSHRAFLGSLLLLVVASCSSDRRKTEDAPAPVGAAEPVRAFVAHRDERAGSGGRPSFVWLAKDDATLTGVRNLADDVRIAQLMLRLDRALGDDGRLL